MQRVTDHHYPLILSDTAEDAHALAETLFDQFDGLLMIGNQTHMVEVLISFYRTESMKSLFLFLQAGLVLVFLMIHGNTILYESNRKELGIYYFSGYDLIRRSLYFILHDRLIFITLVYYLTTKGFSLANSLIYTGILIGIDLVFIFGTLKRRERKELIQTIKNG